MARTPNQFIDPRGILAPYSWHINHDTEQEVGRDRAMAQVAPAAGVGHVLQQGDESPLVFTYSGSILQPEQRDAMTAYFNACHSRTIYFYDCLGNQAEVVITSWKPLRVRCARNPRTGGTVYWTYSITMQVVRVLAGDWLGTPA